MRIAVVVVLATRVVSAEPSASGAPTVTTSVVAPTASNSGVLALAVNVPVGWALDHPAFGGSLYGAIDDHDVIHFNAATWDHARLLGDPGSYTDAGVAWMYFPNHAYDGFSVEVGALLRFRDTRTYTDDASSSSDNYKTTIYAGRALVGWSWLGWQRVFVSLQLGASVGREKGTHTSHVDNIGQVMDTTTAVDRVAVAGEAFMRFGLLLGER